MPAEMPRAFHVEDRRQETHDTWTLRLRPADGEACPSFAPGQFAMLYAFGAGEVPISVSAIPGAGATVHTVRIVGAASRAVCAAPTLGLRGPFGAGWPLPADGTDVVIVAGGLGLAPLRPVVHALLADRERHGRVTVMCGGRSPSELLYRGELAEWRRAGLEVGVTVDVPEAGWDGEVGVVTRLIRRAALDPTRTTAMACGPEVMMRFAAAALREQGVPAESVWVSLERSMKCATGHCGHCQLGPLFVCKDGPVMRYDRVERWMGVPEL